MEAQARYTQQRRILGDKLFDKVRECKLLVVGAGGIGCELLKNLVMTGFGNIQILDLDTIDLSNLNRQFLFQKQHVKRPKAVVARETALKFNPDVDLVALHRNIKDADFNVDYFKSFDMVMNALDNLDARRHVNRMCLAAGVPLIESGTSGYIGQVQPIGGGKTECFDCTGKPVPKTFAVCTIRSTPSTPHHCIAWAKTYLFPQLFGTDEDDAADGAQLDEAEKSGENAGEIRELRKESEAIRRLRETLSEPGAPKRVFDKVYTEDIERLLQLEGLWQHRDPPHALSYGELSKAEPSTTAAEATTSSSNGASTTNNGAPASASEVHKIKDQRALSTKDSFDMFLDSVERLVRRLATDGGPLSFDKDDDDTLDFVTSAANLRAACFNIDSQTRFQVKEYAGNIIAAIATTNAIIAGVMVLQAMHVLRNDWDSARNVFLARRADKVFSTSRTSEPNKYCAVCQAVYAPLSLSPQCSVGDFVEQVVVGKLGFDGHAIVQLGTEILYETEDYEDNAAKTLASVGVAPGAFLTVLDDDEPHVPVLFSIGTPLPDNTQPALEITGHVPEEIPLKPAPPPERQDSDSDSDDDEIVIGDTVKRDPAQNGTAGVSESTRKRKAEGEPDGDSPAKKTKTATADAVVTIDD